VIIFTRISPIICSSGQLDGSVSMYAYHAVMVADVFKVGSRTAPLFKK